VIAAAQDFALDRAPKKGPLGEDMALLSVTEDRLSMLTRMRARLSQEIDVCGDQRSLCLLVTQLRAVLAEIYEVEPAEDCAADQIAARRAARRAGRAKGRGGAA
jgi:hypothetical protein